MKINRILTKQTLKELSKSFSKMADMIDTEGGIGIEYKSIKIEKCETGDDTYLMEVNIRLEFIDGEISESDLSKVLK